jgi:hypothetical protein
MKPDTTSVENNIKRGEFKAIKLPVDAVEAANFIVYHKTRPLSPVAQDFLKLLRAHRARFKSKEQTHVGSRGRGLG